MSQEDGSTTDHFRDLVTDERYIEAAKKLESFKAECETHGIYDETKSLAQMRYELSLAKDKTDIRRLLQ